MGTLTLSDIKAIDSYKEIEDYYDDSLDCIYGLEYEADDELED